MWIPHAVKNRKKHVVRVAQITSWNCKNHHIISRWTMLLIRTLGARIRISLVCEGGLHVMSFKMVDC